MFERILAFVVLSVLLFAATVAGDSEAERDRVILAAWKTHVLDPKRVTKHTDGEDICWLVTPYLRGMVAMGEARGDVESLDAYCKAFEHLMSVTGTDLDGLFGWPTTKGSYGRHGPRCIIMNDAHIAFTVAEFARVVRADPDLKARYGARADAYLKFIEEKIFRKWKDAWLELGRETTTLRRRGNRLVREKVDFPGPAGVYRFYEPGKRPGRSLPLNQFLSVAKAFLALHDVTGKPDYLEKARKMALTAKHVYLVKESDRYRPWCYWQPVWQGDFKGPTEPVGWTGPHPKRSSYHAVEVDDFTRFHKRKIVFTDNDMKRLVRLHLDVMWNKDPDRPAFGYDFGPRKQRYPAQLWTSLAYVDETIEKMTNAGRTPEILEKFAGRWRGIAAVPAYFARRKP